MAGLPYSIETRSCGAQIVRSTADLQIPDRCVSDRLFRWAALAPDRTFIAGRRRSGEWQRLSFAAAAASVKRLAGHLLRYDLSAERPLVILSRNSLEHALLMLAALHAGIPFCALPSSLYVDSQSKEPLRGVLRVLTPGLVYMDEEAEPVLAEVMALHGPVIAGEGAILAQLAASGDPHESEVDRANARVGPSKIAKFLLTSGTTGSPKLVIQTHGMMLANQAMLAHAFPFLEKEPPVLVDWLPWSHAFGSNHNFGIALYHGGSFYIDSGKPTPSGIAPTLANLRETSPAIYFNVPSGFDLLLHHLQSDDVLARRFFERLRMLFYGAASLSARTREGFDDVAARITGRKIPFLTGYGATETAPAALVRFRDDAEWGSVGLPLPGTSVKLIPCGDTFEARVSGLAVTPGYWRNEAATRAAFDDDGYFRIGDALRWTVDGDPAQGLSFDGRLAEDFKLANGEWVRTGRLAEVLTTALGGLVKQTVIIGPGRPFVTALLCLGPEAPSGVSFNAGSLSGEIRQRIAEELAHGNASIRRVRRLLILDAPLSARALEITGKGSVNARLIERTRRNEIALLYGQHAAAPVIDLSGL
jgi:feruloyl-CoA synthase